MAIWVLVSAGSSDEATERTMAFAWAGLFCSAIVRTPSRAAATLLPQSLPHRRPPLLLVSAARCGCAAAQRPSGEDRCAGMARSAGRDGSRVRGVAHLVADG